MESGIIVERKEADRIIIMIIVLLNHYDFFDKYPGVKRGMLRCCFVSTGEGELAKLQEANLA